MALYLAIMAGSVFLGTELFALPLPFAQLSIYRFMAFLLMPMMVYHLIIRKKDLVWEPHLGASRIYLGYLAFFAFSLVGILWAEYRPEWFRANFLIFLGLLSITGLFFYIRTMKEWRLVFHIVWWFMVALLFMGLYESLTGRYILGDEAFITLWGENRAPYERRVAFTIFANPNDFASFVTAFVALSTVKIFRIKNIPSLVFTVFLMAISVVLVYESESRLSLACLGLILILFIYLSWLKTDITFHLNGEWAFILAGVGISLRALYPKIARVVYIMTNPGTLSYTSSGQIRLGLLKNGLVFLAQSYGLGIGSGNIRPTMAIDAIFETGKKADLHNWWGEILVGNGIIGFFIYLVTYILTIMGLADRRKNPRFRPEANALLIFVIVWILLSQISSNNMSVEWHWVIFGLVISFLKVSELEERNEQ